MTVGRRLALRRPRRLGLLVPVLVLPLLGPPALALAATRTAAVPATQTQDELNQREQAAAGALEDSSAAVQAAAAALSKVAAELPPARAEVDRTAGELAGARARVTEAEAEVGRAEAALGKAQVDVADATASVAQGREAVGALARRSYQRGRLTDLQQVVEAGEPENVLERANMLRAVFRYQDDSLERLTRDRLTLAGRQAGLQEQQRQVTVARERAQDQAARSRQVAVDAEQAEARVAELVSRQKSALAGAQTERASDLQDYQAAQDASAALAARIRAAAVKAAAEERKRRAAAVAKAKAAAVAEARAQAADEAARKRAKAANKPVPPPRPRRQAAPAPQRDGELRWPCYGCRLTSNFGYRIHPIFGDRRFHAGVDMGAPIGTPVHAAAGGIVTYAGYASGYGTLVVVSHGQVNGHDLSTAYAHMSALLVRVGQAVDGGDLVGRVGNVGNSTGPHLHWEVRVDGTPVDPLGYARPS